MKGAARVLLYTGYLEWILVHWALKVSSEMLGCSGSKETVVKLLSYNFSHGLGPSFSVSMFFLLSQPNS